MEMLLSRSLPWLAFLVGLVGAQLRGDFTKPAVVPGESPWNDNVDELNEEGSADGILLEELEIESLYANTSGIRNLNEDHGMFQRLQCNQGDRRCSKGSTTWTSMNFKPNDGKVTIPCGWCVTMDFGGEELSLPYGLNIEGHLSFPNGYKVTIKTPFVLVQGTLELFARRKVTDTPSIKFILTGTDEEITSFIPADNNRFACSPAGVSSPRVCKVGRKPFVVAGGKVTFRGLIPGCPSWVHLEDVARDDLPTPSNIPTLDVPNSGLCGSLGRVYMEDDFSTTANVHGWTGGYGALFGITPGDTFEVTDRVDADEHGPTYDLRTIRDCLVPDQDYLFRARIRLTTPGVSNGVRTTCSSFGINCVTLQSTVKTPDKQISRRKGWEEKEHERRYGVWQDFYATVTYSAEELDSTNIYQILNLRGPEPKVDIEMDDIKFSLPPPGASPDPSNVCGDNLVLNGDAELDPIHPYPIDHFGGVLSVEEENDGNQYFHHYARESDIDSVLYKFTAPDCLVANGKYHVSARIRINSGSPVKSRIELRSTFDDKRVVQRVIAECPASTRASWVKCQAPFTLLEELTGDNLESIRLQFETYDAPTVDMDIDDIRLVLADAAVTSIIVPDNGVSECWGQGAEVLVTSHTLNYDDGQVRRIASAPKPFGNGLVELELDSAIAPPTTRKQSKDFAVEVALLSRNILIEGSTDDDDSLIGGHFMVFHTPDVDQVVEGVEFYNMGQQGEIGRYPIHFHLSGDVQGAVVSKNLIRASNQRCVVVHGSHNVTVVDNVSYDTQGHCYMTEDGGETGNVFSRNLGALTHAIPKANLVRSVESDDFPSTFWCSNPLNTWIGNVAAGSRNNGFWFELQLAVRTPTANMPGIAGMNPRFLAFGEFRDNVAHSNGMHGLRTYPEGYFPPEEAVFYNTRSFKNKQGGVFFHNSRNLAVSGGVLADNMIQLDFDRGAEFIRVENTMLIGVTDLYKQVVRSQPTAPAHSDVVIGLEIHGFTLDMSREGGTIRDVTFSGFADTLADHTALIQMDDDVTHGHFDYWTTIEGVTITDDVTPAQFDFTGLMGKGVDNVYFTDLDSSMRPRGSDATGVSTVISNTPAMTQFIDLENCEEFPERAYMYCEDTCLRTVLFSVPPSMTDDFVLRINQQGDRSVFMEVNGKFDYETIEKDGSGGLDEVANTWFRKRRHFGVALPAGTYVFRFYLDNKLDWPTSVEITMEKPQCPTSLEANMVKVGKPDATESECAELVQNGSFGMSDSEFPYWVQHESGMEVVRGQGIENTNALSQIDETSPANGFIGQFLDTRCLKKGRQYVVEAWVELTRNGSPVSCDSLNGCPKARLKLRKPEDESRLSFIESNMDLVDFFERPYRDEGWNLLQGTFTVDDEIEESDSVLLFIEKGKAGVKMLLDNVSVSLVPEDCSELVFNGDFANGKSSFWYTDYAAPKLAMAGKALQMKNRSSFSHSPSQNIRTGCMVEGARYLALARVRLNYPNGNLFTCDPTRSPGNELTCPRMRLRSFIDSGESMVHDGGSIAITDHGTVGGWYTMSGAFIANEFDAAAVKSVLYFDQVSKTKDFVVDDVSIIPLPDNCNQLFLNGDAEFGGGEAPSFWTHWGVNGGEKIAAVPTGSTNHAFRVYGRSQTSDGIHQFIDPRCLTVGTKWRLTARMKLVSAETGKGVTCDPLDDCPLVRIAGWISGAREEEQTFSMTNRPNWSANLFNRYEVEFTVNRSLANSDRVSVGIRTYDIDWEMYLDDITLRPVS